MKIFALLSLVATSVLAQATPSEDLLAIQDNSFLLEEAYNQDPGVVQYINTYADGVFTFTNELPLFGSMKHQFSYSLSLDDRTIGDVVLNYRYQLLGDSKSPLAISPRVSVIVPTDDGDNGVQLALPISVVLAPRVAAHTNLVATWLDGFEPGIGQSFVYAPNARVQLLVEGVWTRDDLLINPGIRTAINLRNGLQIVPGASYAFSREGDGVALLYLSFEK
ncbi:MAG TPA: hypothetical protein VN181_11570 [Thermoanaerobaculia bacterium]|nr:hypothetical protein [Thermoanaerobaculia bacterium]